MSNFKPCTTPPSSAISKDERLPFSLGEPRDAAEVRDLARGAASDGEFRPVPGTCTNVSLRHSPWRVYVRTSASAAAAVDCDALRAALDTDARLGASEVDALFATSSARGTREYEGRAYRDLAPCSRGAEGAWVALCVR